MPPLEEEQNYEIVKIDSVTEWPDNARRGDVEAIKKSIEVLGFRGAIIVQQSTRHIVVGNHRWRAAKELGFEQIPALIADIDDDRARALVAADNHSHDLGTYDSTALAAFIEEIQTKSPDLLDATGYTTLDMDTILSTKPEPPPTHSEPVGGAGYVWANLGRLQARVKGPAYKARVQEILAEHNGDETAAAIHVARLLGFKPDDLVLD